MSWEYVFTAGGSGGTPSGGGRPPGAGPTQSAGYTVLVSAGGKIIFLDDTGAQVTNPAIYVQYSSAIKDIRDEVGDVQSGWGAPWSSWKNFFAFVTFTWAGYATGKWVGSAIGPSEKVATSAALSPTKSIDAGVKWASNLTAGIAADSYVLLDSLILPLLDDEYESSWGWSAFFSSFATAMFSNAFYHWGNLPGDILPEVGLSLDMLGGPITTPGTPTRAAIDSAVKTGRQIYDAGWNTDWEWFMDIYN